MLISDIQLFLLSSHLFEIFLMLKNTIKIAYLCTHDYCVDIGKANHVFYNLERMIQKWKVGPTFSGWDHLERMIQKWKVGPKFSGGDHIFRPTFSEGAYLCTHDYCVDIGKANHVFYNLERMIQKWKVGPKFSGGDHIFRPKFSEGDHIFRKNWSAGTKIFFEHFGPRTIFTGTNIPVTDQLTRVGDRSEWLQELSRSVTASNSFVVYDCLRFFCGDKSAQQFERGTRVSFRIWAKGRQNGNM